MNDYDYAQAKRDMDAYRKAVKEIAYDTACSIICSWEPYDERLFHPEIFSPAMKRLARSVEEAIGRFLGECLAGRHRSQCEDDSTET